MRGGGGGGGLIHDPGGFFNLRTAHDLMDLGSLADGVEEAERELGECGAGSANYKADMVAI